MICAGYLFLAKTPFRIRPHVCKPRNPTVVLVFLSGCLTHIASAVVKFILEITCSTFSIKKKLLSASNFLQSLYFILNNFDFMATFDFYLDFVTSLSDLSNFCQN